MHRAVRAGKAELLMTDADGHAAAHGPADGRESWRQRAVERSLSAARAKAQSRNDRYIKNTIAIIGETGRTDFTVQEVVERSKTSLRAFYQHFRNKDELLLAVLEEIMAHSTQVWRCDAASLDSAAALRMLIEKVSAQPGSSKQDSINRALSIYNDQLAATRPQDYARVLSPLYDLCREILRRGIEENVFRSDIDVDETAAVVMHAVLGAMRLSILGAELSGRPVPAERLFDFCMRGLRADGA